LPVVFAVSMPCAEALEVRGYVQSLHNRMYLFPGLPLFNQVPVINPTFFADSSKLRAVGWPAHETEWYRHMGLISPKHVLLATHYPMDAGWKVAFLGADGVQDEYDFVSQVAVVNPQGQPTDLLLCTLATEVPVAAGVVPFRVLNLAEEVAYQNSPLLVCGSAVSAGTAVVDGFTTLVNDPGFDTTRYLYFDYNGSLPGPVGQCNYTGGDSGAPTLVMVSGEPALVGVNSGRDPLPGGAFRNYASFVPAYLTELDGMMEAEGYHVRRFYPEATSVVDGVAADGVVRRLKAGAVKISVENTGAAVAHNVSVRLTFSEAPTGVAGSWWVCEAESATVWRCRRGGLAGVGELLATWAVLPDEEAVTVGVVRAFDGDGEATSEVAVPLLESYGSWIGDEEMDGYEDDADGDGVSNLLEYAGGGDPQVALMDSTVGLGLLPEWQVVDGEFEVSYVRRVDAVARGISAVLEFSGDLDGWTEVAPPGLTSRVGAPVGGYELVTASAPLGPGALFVRLRVSLSE
jgi:hypothetical protein